MSIERRRLEDFSFRGTIGPAERFKQYQADCKMLPRSKQGIFWLRTLEADPEVKKLFEANGGVRNEKKRRY
jgi:hypothetical protein